jgi:phosphoenolpyruvate carboxykinase (ATP)
MEIGHTRALLRAALAGGLGELRSPDPIFGLAVPKACPDVPSEILDPRSSRPDTAVYDAEARELAAMFAANFKVFAGEVPEEIRAAGPSPRAGETRPRPAAGEKERAG